MEFCFAPSEEITAYYSKLNLIGQLDKNFATPNVFIVDKELNLRGRKGKNLKGENEYKEGYNTISATDLHNEMGDDIKVILYEYRATLKRITNTKDKYNFCKMKNKSYIGISFIILVFGIYFVPKIIDRLKNGDVVKQDRLNSGMTSEKNRIRIWWPSVKRQNLA